MFCFSQTGGGVLSFDGLVYGYHHDPSKGFLKKEKQIVLEGALQGVVINVTDGTKHTTYTNIKGEFQFKLKLGKTYRVELSKRGYTKSVLLIDLRSIPPEVVAGGLTFNSAEFILNSFQSKDTSQINQPFGKLYYNLKTKIIDFQPAEIKSRKGFLTREEESNTPIALMKRSVFKNKNAGIKKHPKDVHKADKGEGAPAIDSTENISEFTLAPNRGIERFGEKDLSVRENEIEQARQQLEKDKLNMVTREDSLVIQAREDLLNQAAAELEGAKKLIELQKNKISTQRILLAVAVCSVLLLSVFLFIIYKQYKEKKLTNLLLNEKNKKITDSINYARRIQQAILLREDEIQKLLPDSFIYYQPKDIVSGDFYWFSEYEDKIIVAAVDCTGHGVPGAFMSLIGNTLLNELVNEKHITKPSLVLKFLHAGILKALHQDTGEAYSRDGMEMSLCVIDRQKKTIEYAGAMNPVYVVKEGGVQTISPDIQSIGGVDHGNRSEFTDHRIPIDKGMCLYLLTDGYMDQFGGPENKKFNTRRFKQLLLDIQPISMNEQKERIANAVQEWQGDYRQVDDMLVIGIKF